MKLFACKKQWFFCDVVRVEVAGKQRTTREGMSG